MKIRGKFRVQHFNSMCVEDISVHLLTEAPIFFTCVTFFRSTPLHPIEVVRKNQRVVISNIGRLKPFDANSVGLKRCEVSDI
jgi:hypothetical protein